MSKNKRLEGGKKKRMFVMQDRGNGKCLDEIQGKD